MRNRPTASELLKVARETLLNELLPRLSSEQKYPALMVANTMAIAAREIESGNADLSEELKMFALLYGEDVVASATSDIDAQVAKLNARLAQDIRTGRFDGKSERLRALLLDRVRARLRISNPKYLKAADPS